MKKFALLIAIAACSGAAFAAGASASMYSDSITETVSIVTMPASDVATSIVSDVTTSAASASAVSSAQ